MLKHLLLKSLSEDAYATIVADRSEFEVLDTNGVPVECGLMLFKVILGESSIDTAQDPNVIRTNLANATGKFQELKGDENKLNEWCRGQMGQLLAQGQTSTDVLVHMQTAF